MYIENLTLNNFRLHKNTQINFSKSLNYIVGGNAQGKTSVLEAIHLISTTKSFSHNSDREIITFGEDFYTVSGKLHDLINDSVFIKFESALNKKQYYLNGKTLDKPADIIGRYPIVFLSPQDSFITEGSPQDRRKFIDSVISQYSVLYLQHLLDYKKILRQRSALLFRYKEDGSAKTLDEIEVWTARLVEIGSKIVRMRREFLGEFESYMEKAFSFIRENIENAEIKYDTFAGEDDDEIENDFLSILQTERSNELRRASNLVGPHKDDFIFTARKISVREFGSQGEHKTFQVALRFAEYFYLKDKLGKNPLFLLDDVFGDLDKNRGKRISDFLGDLGQAFITMTDFTNFEGLRRNADDTVIRISGGTVSYE